MDWFHFASADPSCSSLSLSLSILIWNQSKTLTTLSVYHHHLNHLHQTDIFFSHLVHQFPSLRPSLLQETSVLWAPTITGTFEFNYFSFAKISCFLGKMMRERFPSLRVSVIDNFATVFFFCNSRIYSAEFRAWIVENPGKKVKRWLNFDFDFIGECYTWSNLRWRWWWSLEAGREGRDRPLGCNWMPEWLIPEPEARESRRIFGKEWKMFRKLCSYNSIKSSLILHLQCCLLMDLCRNSDYMRLNRYSYCVFSWWFLVASSKNFVLCFIDPELIYVMREISRNESEMSLKLFVCYCFLCLLAISKMSS